MRLERGVDVVKHILRKLLYAIPVVWGVVTVVFVLMVVVPGDPARIMAGQRGDAQTVARIRADLGLDLPIGTQYLRFWQGLLKGDLGMSYRNNMPVAKAIAERFGNTFRLAFWALVFSAVLGISVGVASAVRQNSTFDYGTMFLAVGGVSAPVFWVGLMLLLIFSYGLEWFPGVGMGGGKISYLILPVLTLGVRPAAMTARLTRSCMLEVLTQDYIRTARSKGLVERIVVFKHALRNALIPVVTVVGAQVAELLSGAVLTETIFAWPGLGRLMVEALINRDFPMIRGTVIVMALLFLVANLLVDVAYAVIDPRVRYE